MSVITVWLNILHVALPQESGVFKSVLCRTCAKKAKVRKIILYGKIKKANGVAVKEEWGTQKPEFTV